MAKGKVVNQKKDVAATWQEALKEFLWWKKAGGLSERTLQDYLGKYYGLQMLESDHYT